MKNLLASKTQAELFERLAKYQCEPSFQIRVVVAGSLEPLTDLAAKESPFPLRVQRVGDFGVGQFNYSSGDLRLAGTLFFCSTPQPNINYIISVCSGTVWHRSILRLVKALYPKLVPVFFSQQELFGLVKQGKAIFSDSELRIIGHSRKQRLKLGRRRKYESSRTRTEKTLEAVFKEAEEQDFWFSSVSFELDRTGRTPKQSAEPLASATLSKYGHFFCTSEFGHFQYGILSKMAELAAQKMKFFSHRSRRERTAFEAKPISITYESTEFTSRKETNHFVDIMRKMTGASCSVLHNNPYVHLSIVDSTDGSAADLWVLKSDEILLVPQLKASEAALKKFVNYIFEEWREGSVSSPTSSDGV
jgi:hypothetical protein